jgi:hypothetical protein
VRPSSDTVPVSYGLVTPSTLSVSDSAFSEDSTAGRCCSSVSLPSSVWKTIWLESVSCAEKERLITSVAVSLSEPGMLIVLTYFVPAA